MELKSDLASEINKISNTTNANGATVSVTVRENGITVKLTNNKKPRGRLNPKISVFREFALATVHSLAEDNEQKQSSKETKDVEKGSRQLFACDLVAYSSIAGLQWKKHLGKKIHVTVVEQRDPHLLLDTLKDNGFTISVLPLDPKRSAGTLLPEQASSEVHFAESDAAVLMLLEAFDFVYIDPHKNPAPYFSTLFRNIRNNGIVCVVVPDTMQFARSPHVVRRSYGAECIKTEYLKELAVRIILASLAGEVAKCNKGLNVLYVVSMEDFLLLCVQVIRGPKMADAIFPNIGQVLHCRICEERVFYLGTMAPSEDPYSMLGCDCKKNVPGKTGVVLGPMWKGSLYDFSFLTKLANAGRSLCLSPAFFNLLQRIMEDCLCDIPPSMHSLMHGLENASSPHALSSNNGTTHTIVNENKSVEACESDCSAQRNSFAKETSSPPFGQTNNDSVPDPFDSLTSRVNDCLNPEDGLPGTATDPVSYGGQKRAASEADAENPVAKRLKNDKEPAPCFFYNVHSKRLGKNHLPKQQAIIERIKAQGYRCCRTHFEKYAIRTNANLKTLMALLGTGESKVLYIKGSHEIV